MRVAIYDRWLHTLGGGERELGAMVQALGDEHDIEIITHQPADLALLHERLNLRVAPDALRVVPFDPRYEAVAACSAEYDLLVNMSHGDLFVPRSRRSVLRVFFPHAARLDDAPDDAPLQLRGGWYEPEGDFAWTGPDARLTLRHAPRTRWSPGTPSLALTLHGWRPAGAAPADARLVANGVALGRRVLPTDGAWTTWRVPLRGTLARAATLDLAIETTTFNPSTLGLSDDNRELGVAVARAGVRADMLHRGTSMSLGDHALHVASHGQNSMAAARAYDLLVANSRFTQRWIERRWRSPSEVLYPPVDVAALVPMTKRPVILSVGRFFAGSHNKKHLPMLAAFRTLCDEGLRGWEYHLVGGCDEQMPEHRAYLQEVRAAAQGYPITLHVNAPFEQLRALYGAASMFWHATGYGEDEEREPERFEHFGISTVEAMAAGCVPVVIGLAGQIEIVEHGVDGLLWRTLPELALHTRRVIEDRALRDRLAANARRRAEDFAPEPFAHAVRRMVAALDPEA